jgi:hypothetical protein
MSRSERGLAFSSSSRELLFKIRTGGAETEDMAVITIVIIPTQVHSLNKQNERISNEWETYSTDLQH